VLYTVADFTLQSYMDYEIHSVCLHAKIKEILHF